MTAFISGIIFEYTENHLNLQKPLTMMAAKLFIYFMIPFKDTCNKNLVTKAIIHSSKKPKMPKTLS